MHQGLLRAAELPRTLLFPPSVAQPAAPRDFVPVEPAWINRELNAEQRGAVRGILRNEVLWPIPPNYSSVLTGLAASNASVLTGRAASLAAVLTGRNVSLVLGSVCAVHRVRPARYRQDDHHRRGHPPARHAHPQARPAPRPPPPVLTGHVSSLAPVLTGHVSSLAPSLVPCPPCPRWGASSMRVFLLCGRGVSAQRAAVLCLRCEPPACLIEPTRVRIVRGQGTRRVRIVRGQGTRRVRIVPVQGVRGLKYPSVPARTGARTSESS